MDVAVITGSLDGLTLHKLEVRCYRRAMVCHVHVGLNPCVVVHCWQTHRGTMLVGVDVNGGMVIRGSKRVLTGNPLRVEAQVPAGGQALAFTSKLSVRMPCQWHHPAETHSPALRLTDAR